MGIGLTSTSMADEALAKGELQRVTSSKCVTGNGEFSVSLKHRKRTVSAENSHRRSTAQPCPSVAGAER
jgi:hypothetical protein